MTDQAATTWRCPKDGMVMQARRRRSGVWRCPTCRGIFIDTEAMRRGRKGQFPKWAPFVTSILMSVLATFVVRRFLRRAGKDSSSQPPA